METQEIDEIEKLYDELRREPSPEDYRKAYDDRLKEIEDEKDSTMLFDPTEKDYRTYEHCKKKYGLDLANKMLHAKRKNNGQLDKEDYTKLMNHNQHVKKQVAPAPKPVIAKAPFLMLDHAIIKTPKIRKILKKSMMLYLHLRTYIVREKFPGDVLDLYDRFFKKGKLATSISTRKLAQDFEIDKNTVSAYLQEMSEHKVIEIEQIHAADAYDNQLHNVYVLGHHDFSKKETYLIQKLATSDG